MLENITVRFDTKLWSSQFTQIFYYYTHIILLSHVGFVPRLDFDEEVFFHILILKRQIINEQTDKP